MSLWIFGLFFVSLSLFQSILVYLIHFGILVHFDSFHFILGVLNRDNFMSVFIYDMMG